MLFNKSRKLDYHPEANFSNSTTIEYITGTKLVRGIAQEPDFKKYTVLLIKYPRIIRSRSINA